MQPTVILASTSPRRREFLSTLKIPFRALNPAVEEVPLPGEAPESYVARNARLKAEAVAMRKDLNDEALLVVIAADTIVVLNDQILEKPLDQKDATRMLRALSGKQHLVYSGLHVIHRAEHGTRVMALVVKTEVNIKKLSEAEIAGYIATGEPMDKAGAYAAQGIGSYMVEAIHGSYTNVVGLPLTELIDCLASCGVPLF